MDGLTKMNQIMLRLRDNAQIGSTAFFRNRPLLDTLLSMIRKSQKKKLNVLFHACSIGAEPYSFVVHALMQGLVNEFQIRIKATDINSNFLANAQQGIYPAQVTENMEDEEKKYFEPHENDKVKISDCVLQKVEFIPPSSFVDFTSEEPFDIVFVMNAMTYVSPDGQAVALKNIASYNSSLLITTAFHPDTVKRDMVANGYEPLTMNIEAIHNSWVERIYETDLLDPASPEYSWKLPKFSKIDQYEFRYRYCSIFRKEAFHGFG